MNSIINMIVSFSFSVLKLRSKTNVIATIQAMAGAALVFLPLLSGALGDNTAVAGYILVAKSVVDAVLRWNTTASVEEKLK